LKRRVKRADKRQNSLHRVFHSLFIPRLVPLLLVVREPWSFVVACVSLALAIKYKAEKGKTKIFESTIFVLKSMPFSSGEAKQPESVSRSSISSKP